MVTLKFLKSNGNESRVVSTSEYRVDTVDGGDRIVTFDSGDEYIGRGEDDFAICYFTNQSSKTIDNIQPVQAGIKR